MSECERYGQNCDCCYGSVEEPLNFVKELPPAKCAVPGCERKCSAQALCGAHYYQLTRGVTLEHMRPIQPTPKHMRGRPYARSNDG